MCGIAGIFAFNQIGSFYMINLAKATDKLEKRGPDGRGVYIDDFVGLGHRRLSIIDVSASGSQPMTDESKRYVIVFNGEIFNYREIKKQLRDKGITFTSESDTEVLLKLYIHKGKDCLNELVGFFSFAIYDKEEKSLFIARDRMGIKPLYYYHDEDKFVFGSELKALLAFNIPKELDFTSLYTYFQLNYIPGSNSIFQNIFRLTPGNYLWVRKKEVKQGNYYSVPYNPARIVHEDYETQQRKLVELMEESVRMRLVADVPLGVFLSGGIDSSVVTALAARNKEKVDTFSIGFKDNPYMDETSYAQLVAKKYATNHTVFQLSNEDYEENIFEILEYMDEPFADSSCLPTYILSKNVRRQVKVALSGDGGDELFAGYNKHAGEYRLRNSFFWKEVVSVLGPLWEYLPKSKTVYWQNKIRQLHKFAEGNKLGVNERYWRWCGHMDLSETQTLLKPAQEYFNKNEFNLRKAELLKYLTEDGDLNDVLRTDVELVLAGDMLVKTDRMSMANSLEVRVPFLDHRVVNYAFTLPERSKIDKARKKKIVQDAFRELLPVELYNRPKKGFDVPLTKFYRKSLKSLIKDNLLEDDFIRSQNLFNPEVIRRIREQAITGNADQEKVWALLIFQYWYKKYI